MTRQNVTTSLVIPFEAKEPVRSAGVGITLENWVDDVPAGSFAVKLTPNVGAVMYASHGEVRRVRDGTEPVAESFLTLSGSESFQIPQGASWSPVFVFRAPDSKESGIGYTREGNTIKVNQPIWGLIRISAYTRSYAIYAYTPAYRYPSGGRAGLLVTVGTIAAYYQGQMATLEVQNVLGVELGTDEFEIYRITSKSLVNDEGEWEYPPNWPGSGAYPSNAQPEPEPEIGLVTSRVHEIGYANWSGDVWTRTQIIPIAKPFTGSESYKPVLTLEKTGYPDGLPTDAVIRIEQALAARGKGIVNNG